MFGARPDKQGDHRQRDRLNDHNQWPDVQQIGNPEGRQDRCGRGPFDRASNRAAFVPIVDGRAKAWMAEQPVMHMRRDDLLKQ